MLTAQTLDELAWYANGTLPEADRARVERELEQSAEMRAQLAFYRQVQAELRQSVPAIAPEHGLNEVMRRIQQDKRQSAPAAKTSWLQRLWPAADNPWGRVGLTACAAIMLAQFGVIGAFMQGYLQPKDYSDVRNTVSTVVTEGPFVRISFKLAVEQDAVRFLLLESGASIIGGPSQVGDYYLYIDPKRLDQVLPQLQASPLVDRAVRIEQLPAGRG